MPRPSRPDPVSIVGGLVLLVFGGVLAMDAAGVVDLTFEVLGPLVCGALGAVLVALGLARED